MVLLYYHFSLLNSFPELIYGSGKTDICGWRPGCPIKFPKSHSIYVVYPHPLDLDSIGFHWMKPETPETPIFHGKIHGFQWRCSHQNQSIDIRPAQLLHRALIAKAPARRWGVYMHMIRVYDTYPLASMQKTGKSQCLSTLSMAIFNSKLLVYQRVVNLG